MSNYTPSKPKLHNPKSHSPAVYIPCWLIQIPVTLLSHGAKLVYGRLSQWSNESGQVFRSAPELSKELGMCVSSIEKFCRELRDEKLIGTYQPQKGGKNHFVFYDHHWMHEDINKELSYKQEDTSYQQHPPYDCTAPPVSSYGTPPYDHTDINIKEIKTNKKDNNNNNKEQKKNKKQLHHKETFEQFWELYPEKKSKKKSFEIWKRKKLWAIADEIIDKVSEQIENDQQWLDGYIPYPTTYLNQERWQDEITKPIKQYKKEKVQEDNQKKTEQIERASRERLTHEQIKLSEKKNKGLFKQISSLALNPDSESKPPIEHLNNLLNAAGATRKKR